MDTKMWGKPAWTFLHTISFNYKPTPQNKKIYKEFFKCLTKILPCKLCRDSFKRNSKELPIDNYLGSKERLTYWLYLMHNKVNDKLRKQGKFHTKNGTPKHNPSFDTVKKKYNQFIVTCDFVK
jgi:hypothetical protein